MPPKPKPQSAFPEPAAPLPGEADLLAAVVANLSDDTAKLVYADWLEEHDDPRGAYLRKTLPLARAGKKFATPKFAPESWRDLVGLTLLQKIHAAKLTKHTDTILRLARPAVSFESKKAADKKLPIGASKLGGGPDLPPDAEWPVFEDEPLAFLAQFNLADLAASLVCRELPASGLLSVFYAPDEEDDRGEDPPGSFQVFHFPDVSKLTRHLTPERAFNSCRLTFTEILTVPDPNSVWRKDLGLGKNEDTWDAYQEQIAGFDSGHRILGYPNPIQSDVLEKKTVRHLLTIGGDDHAGMEWFDGGSLYFTINEADLRKRRFDRVKLEMQCG